MNKHYLTRNGFEAIFEDCMNCREVYFADGTTGEDTPRMIIRDFETANPMSADGDKEFFRGDFKKAWEYFKKIDRIRVMNLSGSILLDAFFDGDDEE